MKRIAFGIFCILLMSSVLFFIKSYKSIIYPNTSTAENYSLYIYSNDDFETIKNKLYSDSLVINKKSFEWVAKKLDYPKYIKSGHYIIKDGMSNHHLLNMLRSGSQTPVKFTFNNIRTLEQLAARIDEQLELDSLAVLNAIKGNATLKEMGFDKENFAALFIPNTYELYWNIDANEFVEKMINEYNKFWNEERINKAKSLNITPIEASILASIVDKETTKVSEMSRIAGVYINR